LAGLLQRVADHDDPRLLCIPLPQITPSRSVTRGSSQSRLETVGRPLAALTPFLSEWTKTRPSTPSAKRTPRGWSTVTMYSLSRICPPPGCCCFCSPPPAAAITATPGRRRSLSEDHDTARGPGDADLARPPVPGTAAVAVMARAGERKRWRWDAMMEIGAETVAGGNGAARDRRERGGMGSVWNRTERWRRLGVCARTARTWAHQAGDNRRRALLRSVSGLRPHVTSRARHGGCAAGRFCRASFHFHVPTYTLGPAVSGSGHLNWVIAF
jgi:hypothetical protein